MSDNQDLINALAGSVTDERARDPAWRQTLTQRYAPDLSGMPDMLRKYLAEALKVAPLGLGFRGPIMSGPAKGLAPQDFATATRMENAARAADLEKLGWVNPAIMGGLDDPRMAAAGGYTRRPIPSPDHLAPDPYDLAVARQTFARKAANTQ